MQEEQLSDHDDNLCIQKCLAGEVNSFEPVVHKYQKLVYNIVYRIVGNQSDAEDLAQESFVRAYRALDRFDPSRRFSSWIISIATNLSIDFLRKKRVKMMSTGHPVDGRERPFCSLLADPGDNPEEQLEKKERGFMLEKALTGLQPRYRTAVILRDQWEYSYSEISAIMGVPVNTVRTWIRRGRRELAKIITGELKKGEL
jgi:RNA polymerase sigma-70 factor (ECF subfamily)